MALIYSLVLNPGVTYYVRKYYFLQIDCILQVQAGSVCVCVCVCVLVGSCSDALCLSVYINFSSVSIV